MEQVRRTGLIGQVTELLRGEIRAGRWAVGAKIPTEPELAELTGAGRNTVREAVQALVHAGMLERRQGSGTFVVATSDLGGALSKYFADAHERDVLELRQALDITAAALAARRRTPDDVDNLLRLKQLRRAEWDANAPTRIATDIEFHRAIVAASHNEVYLEFYDTLNAVMQQVVRQRVGKGDQAYHDEHEALAQAVVDGDPERAAQKARCFFDEMLADYGG